MLGGRGLGRLLHRSPQFGSDVCRKQGGASLPFHRPARVGGSAKCDYWPVQATPEHMYSESTSSVPHIKGGGHCSTGEGGCKEEGGGRQDGEVDERGEEGSVDGNAERTRVGEKREVPWVLVEDGIGSDGIFD